MKKTICDRCKKEIFYDPRQQTILPMVSIYKLYNLMDRREVDLCDNCREEFLSWLDGKNIPVTPQPKIGQWIERESGTEDKENGFETVVVCSNCDFPATTFYSEDCESRTQIRTHFCPNCGAKMED